MQRHPFPVTLHDIVEPAPPPLPSPLPSPMPSPLPSIDPLPPATVSRPSQPAINAPADNESAVAALATKHKRRRDGRRVAIDREYKESKSTGKVASGAASATKKKNRLRGPLRSARLEALDGG